ncbi:type II toxin-antitoxin system ParD family antitoxin [Paraglaciecola chathamensis]|jgi:Arc/MetJ-type ribon-helix-helix transcriptional regulator|nr:type II toxin-antitoxin system ParD family antitoxin [Paraglaciecola chathamensis]
MARNASIILGGDDLISSQIKSGRYDTASEVIPSDDVLV